MYKTRAATRESRIQQHRKAHDLLERQVCPGHVTGSCVGRSVLYYGTALSLDTYSAIYDVVTFLCTRMEDACNGMVQSII